ncbi:MULTISPECIES: hypothetical protein [Exiguobacterium]|nr:MULTISPECIES: hypothetical protein [unclassified Exiguobacterium]
MKSRPTICSGDQVARNFSTIVRRIVSSSFVLAPQLVFAFS